MYTTRSDLVIYRFLTFSSQQEINLHHGYSNTMHFRTWKPFSTKQAPPSDFSFPPTASPFSLSGRINSIRCIAFLPLCESMSHHWSWLFWKSSFIKVSGTRNNLKELFHWAKVIRHKKVFIVMPLNLPPLPPASFSSCHLIVGLEYVILFRVSSFLPLLNSHHFLAWLLFIKNIYLICSAF